MKIKKGITYKICMIALMMVSFCVGYNYDNFD